MISKPSSAHVAKLMKQGYNLEQIAAAYKIRELLSASPRQCPVNAICYLSGFYPEIVDSIAESASILGAVIGATGTLQGKVKTLVGYKKTNDGMYLSAAVTKLLESWPPE